MEETSDIRGSLLGLDLDFKHRHVIVAHELSVAVLDGGGGSKLSGHPPPPLKVTLKGVFFTNLFRFFS